MAIRGIYPQIKMRCAGKELILRDWSYGIFARFWSIIPSAAVRGIKQLITSGEGRIDMRNLMDQMLSPTDFCCAARNNPISRPIMV